MKVKMLTLSAGPDGTRQPGKVYLVSADEGKVLVDGGYAVEVKSTDAVKADAPSTPRAATRQRGRTATKPDADEANPAETGEDGDEA
jgi:hypothetical protein